MVKYTVEYTVHGGVDGRVQVTSPRRHHYPVSGGRVEAEAAPERPSSDR